jgi:RNA polymerase sigma factor (sigma-70 family)
MESMSDSEYNRICRTARRVIGNSYAASETEDLVQETVIKCFRHHREGEIKTAYVEATARCVLRDYLRKERQKDTKAERLYNETPTCTSYRASEHTVAEEIRWRTQKEAFRRVLESSPPQTARMVELKKLGFSDMEIAQELGTTIGSVKSRLHRFREEVKVCFNRICSRE